MVTASMSRQRHLHGDPGVIDQASPHTLGRRDQSRSRAWVADVASVAGIPRQVVRWRCAGRLWADDAGLRMVPGPGPRRRRAIGAPMPFDGPVVMSVLPVRSDAACLRVAESARRACHRRRGEDLHPATGGCWPGAAVAVAAGGARLGGVMVSTSGNALVGHLASGGTTWRSSGALALSRTYTVIALAVGTDGKKFTTTSSFRTLTPSQTFQATSLEGDNQQYGVGMPIVLTFSRAITTRPAVERALRITSSQPLVGASHGRGNN